MRYSPPKPDAYEKRADKREASRQRRLMGESLEAFHARETASPPALNQIYADNHRNRERCADTIDLFDQEKKNAAS